MKDREFKRVNLNMEVLTFNDNEDVSIILSSSVDDAESLMIEGERAKDFLKMISDFVS